jgi:hypothetical protein
MIPACMPNSVQTITATTNNKAVLTANDGPLEGILVHVLVLIYCCVIDK